MSDLIVDEPLIRAAFRLCNEPAPLNDEEIRRRDERHARARVGNTVRLTQADMAAQSADAQAARSRVLQRQFPDVSTRQTAAVLAVVGAMNSAGQSIGYRLGEAGKRWNDGLAELQQKHPGFPADLYRAALQSGMNQAGR